MPTVVLFSSSLTTTTSVGVHSFLLLLGGRGWGGGGISRLLREGDSLYLGGKLLKARTFSPKLVVLVFSKINAVLLRWHIFHEAAVFLRCFVLSGSSLGMGGVVIIIAHSGAFLI